MRKEKTLYIVVLRSARQRSFFVRVCAACIGDESAVIVKTLQTAILYIFFFYPNEDRL